MSRACGTSRNSSSEEQAANWLLMKERAAVLTDHRLWPSLNLCVWGGGGGVRWWFTGPEGSRGQRIRGEIPLDIRGGRTDDRLRLVVHQNRGNTNIGSVAT